MRRTILATALFFTLGGTSAVARAAEISLTAGGTTTDTDRGAFNSSSAFQAGLPWKVTSNSWQVRWGVLPAGFAEVTRNYALFQVPALAAGEQITAAALQLPHPANSYESTDSSETLQMWSIDSTSVADLRSNALVAPGTGNRPDIFADLGSGTSYGTYQSTAAMQNGVQTVQLNAAALAALNTVAHAGGGTWGLGTALVSEEGNSGNQRVFRGTGGSFNVNPTVLKLTTQTTAAQLTCQPGLAQEYAQAQAAYNALVSALTSTVLPPGFDAAARTPNSTNYATLRSGTLQLAGSTPGLRVILSDQAGAVVVDSARSDNSFAAYVNQQLGENQHQFTGTQAAQQFECGVGIQRRVAIANQGAQTSLAFRVGDHLSGSMTLRLSLPF